MYSSAVWGLGFTLKRTLQLVGQDAKVEVNELLPEILDWNREHLADLNGKTARRPPSENAAARRD